MDVAATKREKRRKSIASKLKYLNESFEKDRDAFFSDSLYTLQSRLYALHNNTDPEYCEKLADLEEERDYRLTELYLWERYQMERVRRQYEEDMQAAIASHDNMVRTVKEKLKVRLETQKKRLAEDRSILNIATDQSFFASAMTACAPTSPGSNMTALSGAERRTLRRRDVSLNSDASGTEGGSRRRYANASDDSGLSGTNANTDRGEYELLKDLDNPRTRGVAKSYNGVKSLRNEEGVLDLAEIADAAHAFSQGP